MLQGKACGSKADVKMLGKWHAEVLRVLLAISNRVYSIYPSFLENQVKNGVNLQENVHCVLKFFILNTSYVFHNVRTWE